MIGEDWRIGRIWNAGDKAEQFQGRAGLWNLSAKSLGRCLISELIFLRVRRIRLECRADIVYFRHCRDRKNDNQ